MTPEIYLDGNATSPVLPAAIAAAVHAMQTCYGNPSSTHTAGLQARALLDGARRRARRVIGAGNGRVMFNSGATEGIQTAVLSALCALRARRDAGEAIGTLLVYGATEHKAVPQSLAHWNAILGLDLELAVLPVDGDGLHDLDALRRLAPRAAMVCTMAANNETGVLSDVAGIEDALRQTGCRAYWMVDCVQALGKFRLQLDKSRIDYAPFSGHKLYAPKGVGMLYVREGAPYTPLIVGGGQEEALRSGTENMAGIAALDAVLAALEQGGVFRTHDQLCDFRERLAASLRRALPGIVFNAPFEHALPTTLNFSVPGLSSRELMDVFDAAGVRVSAGSACSSAKAAPSYVLDAMGLPPWRGDSAIRMSFGPLADDATIVQACERIERCGAALRAASLVASDIAGVPQHGVLQLGSGGECAWMVTDAASRGCVVIDPQPEHETRIAAQLARQGCRLLAVLATAPAPHLRALAQRLDLVAGGATATAGTSASVNAGAHIGADAGANTGGNAGADTGISASAGAGIDAYGWLSGIDALHFGGQCLQRVNLGGGQMAYLLGTDVGGDLPRAAVRHAFIGRAAPWQLAQYVHDDTLLCAARDEQFPFCSSLRAARRQPGDLAGAARAGNAGGTESTHAGVHAAANTADNAAANADGAEAGMHLDAAALRALLARHPDTLLVDVRESWEHAASGIGGADGGLDGHPVLSVPLGRLTGHIGGWLQSGTPLVFCCRSGARSTKAAACLRRLGHPQAYDLAGGMALAWWRALPHAA